MQNDEHGSISPDISREGLLPAGREEEGRGRLSAFLYAAVFDLLTRRISSGDMPPGAILRESSIAHQLGLSRAPVRRALAMLEERGLVRSADGRGFVVGSAAPCGLSPRQLHEILAVADDGLGRSASWERIFSAVLDDVMACLPFGHYRVQEAELGDYYGVSRTVAREVLWRLLDRRLIQKDRKSHWIVSQLCARDLREMFEMRQLLEPRALRRVGGRLDRAWLRELKSRIDAAIADFPACGPRPIDAIERDLYQTMYAEVRNARLIGSIRRNQIGLIIPQLFRRHFTIRDDLPGLQAGSQITHHLLAGDVDVACLLLEAHLVKVEPLTLARLRVLSVLTPPRSAPYLIAIH